MKNLNTQDYVELTILGVITVLLKIIREFELVSEQMNQTLGLSMFVFCLILAFIRLYKIFKVVIRTN